MRGTGQKRRIVEVEDCFYYVPVINLLTSLLENVNYKSALLSDIVVDPNSNLLCDYRDGTHYTILKLFQDAPKALQIELYYDDVEMCNPLGSKVKNIKFYFSNLMF